ncbi:MAG: lipoyl synthase [Saprospiraceae bacterium]|nr:lipoyl synthase [Saprospiraceae bacterium]
MLIELPVVNNRSKDQAAVEPKSSETKPKRKHNKKPKWLRVKLPIGDNYKKVSALVKKYNLHTICQSGHCPNMGECWGAGTATFMILGNVCTRSCSFCAVATGRPPEYDENEPQRVAEAIYLMGVKHAVLTSVNRDERRDRGAFIWHETVRLTKEVCPDTTIETLIPDVRANWDALEMMISPGQEVVSHNMETVEALYRKVRPQAKYKRSLEQIKRTKEYGKRTKTGIMAGLGETKEQVFKTMDDLLEHGCDVLTIGQYLQPTKRHLAVAEFVHPDIFAEYKEVGLAKGFDYVESDPLVRSSYHAERHVHPNRNK